MSKAKLPLALRRQVAARFAFRCAYCQSQEAVLGICFTVDHIIPEVFGGNDEPPNLCLACWDCNLAKGQRIAETDPDTNDLVPLYHPNWQRWHDHFKWQDEGALIVGQTATGRATAAALNLNRAVLVRARRLWIDVRWHPPPP
ncbi:MAG: HNH endonuclease [Truepera sp.]|nr:HNH endonuclease [Truepera sp.]